MADNVDHNLVTLTGKGTFHGMGIIAVSNLANVKISTVKRIKHRLKAADFAKDKGIPVHYYSGSSREGLLKIKFKPIQELRNLIVLPSELFYNLIWHSRWCLSSPETTQQNWLAYMQDVTSGFSNERKDTIQFLPIMDLNPSDENCIHSTLLFVINQAKLLNVKIPSITFDQPLWLKATGISEEDNLNIVCRLGGFHTMMSFIGSLGGMMRGSGLEDLFSEVYADPCVPRLMSGKAVSRALRAHFLAEAALISILLEMCVENGTIEESSLQLLSKMEVRHSDHPEIEDSITTEAYREVSQALADLRFNLKEKSRTASLWFSYLHYVDLLKQSILTERTGCFIFKSHMIY